MPRTKPKEARRDRRKLAARLKSRRRLREIKAASTEPKTES